MSLYCSGVQSNEGKTLLFYNDEILWKFHLIGSVDGKPLHYLKTYGRRHNGITAAIIMTLSYIHPDRSLFEEEVDEIMNMLRSELYLGMRGDCSMPYKIELDPSCKSDDIEKILDSDIIYQPLFLEGL